MNSKKDLILVQIPSYCDPELLATVESALTQADNKERVHLAICYQDDDLTTLEKLKKYPHTKIIHLKKNEAKGLCYARMLCQNMLDDEKYIYQIDSHMRFIKHWDTKLIEELESLNDSKAILSSYPPGYDERMAKLPVDDPMFLKPTYGSVMYPVRFLKGYNYFLDLYTTLIKEDSPLAYQKNALISGNNFFTFSNICKEVPIDPNFIFYGDELAMAIRYYTHGWNVYNPKVNYVYHEWLNKISDKSSYKKYLDIEDKRLENLLNNKDMGIYGLGSVRSIEDFQNFSGINFQDKIIYMNGETGDYTNPKYLNKISYIEQKHLNNYFLNKKEKLIEVIIIDKFNEYAKCLKSCLENSNKKNNIKFLIASTGKKQENNNIKVFKTIKDKTYGKALSYLTKELDNSYVLLIDSSVRFAPGWDEYYTKELDYCGEYSALTSWVWKTDNENHIYKYENKVKEFNKFNNFLPVFKYNKELKIKNPYQTGFISDNFLFCKSYILKDILIDPSLTFEEHQYLYSLRLWTNGINLYYPPLSYVMRLKDISSLKEGLLNKGLVLSLGGFSTYYSRRFQNNYKYDIGNKRSLWTWYNFIKVKYDPDKMTIIRE